MVFITKNWLFLTLAASISSATPTSLVSPRSLTPVTITSAIEECHSAGVDPYGPKPADYSSYDGNVTYSFDGESKFGKWVRAQIQISAEERAGVLHQKRDSANKIGIGLFMLDDCVKTPPPTIEGYDTGDIWIDDVQYWTQYAQYWEKKSVGISYRALWDGEQLDFSTGPGDGGILSSTASLCTTYQYSAAPGTGVGCWNTGLPVKCFELTNNW